MRIQSWVRAGAAAVVGLWMGGCSPPLPTAERGGPGSASTAGEQSGDGQHAVTGRAPVVAGGIPTIVVLEPRHDRPLPEPSGVPYMDQISRIFIPPMLFVRTGHPAEFRNSDEEMHNINVWDLETRQQVFNVAVPIDGAYVHRFEQAGVYDVSCDVHPGMSAQIVATSTPYVTLADGEGRFEFRGVVAGEYELVVYAGAQTIRQTVAVTGVSTLVDVR